MATPSKNLPRDIQNDLHDIADRVGERVAQGEMVDMAYNKSSSPHLRTGIKCSCSRYSELKNDNKVVFWNEVDPECEYMHLQPLPAAFAISLP
jgi:hypothetical protein